MASFCAKSPRSTGLSPRSKPVSGDARCELADLRGWKAHKNHHRGKRRRRTWAGVSPEPQPSADDPNIGDLSEVVMDPWRVQSCRYKRQNLVDVAPLPLFLGTTQPFQHAREGRVHETVPRDNQDENAATIMVRIDAGGEGGGGATAGISPCAVLHRRGRPMRR